MNGNKEFEVFLMIRRPPRSTLMRSSAASDVYKRQSVDGVRAEVMLHTLEDRQIYVSAGSACSSNKPAISSTLKSIGLKPSLLDSTIRFSFCVNTTQEEIDYAVSVMAEVIPMLRRYTRR